MYGLLRWLYHVLHLDSTAYIAFAQTLHSCEAAVAILELVTDGNILYLCIQTDLATGRPVFGE